jgi:hypothetical protein
MPLSCYAATIDSRKRPDALFFDRAFLFVSWQHLSGHADRNYPLGFIHRQDHSPLFAPAFYEA